MMQSFPIYLFHACNIGSSISGNRDILLTLNNARHAVDPQLLITNMLISEMVNIVQLLQEFRYTRMDTGHEFQQGLGIIGRNGTVGKA